MRPVRLAILIACGMARISDFINTTSAASSAASAPLPIAAPTSAPASTGASLMPSPTNITLPYFAAQAAKFVKFYPAAAVWHALHLCLRQQPLPVRLLSASPVSMAVVSPMALISFTASTASSLMVSAITICPMYLPFLGKQYFRAVGRIFQSRRS